MNSAYAEENEWYTEKTLVFSFFFFFCITVNFCIFFVEIRKIVLRIPSTNLTVTSPRCFDKTYAIISSAIDKPILFFCRATFFDVSGRIECYPTINPKQILFKTAQFNNGSFNVTLHGCLSLFDYVNIDWFYETKPRSLTCYDCAKTNFVISWIFYWFYA